MVFLPVELTQNRSCIMFSVLTGLETNFIVHKHENCTLLELDTLKTNLWPNPNLYNKWTKFHAILV